MPAVYPRTMTDEEFITLYRTLPNKELCRILGKSQPTVTRRARLLGVTKDPEAANANKRGHKKSAAFSEAVAQRNRTRVWTDEQRQKLSAAHSGKVISDNTRARISAANKGKRKPEGFGQKVATWHTGKKRPESMRANLRAAIAASPKRKHGVTRKPHERYTPLYAQWRRACLIRDNYTCQDCGRVFIPGQRGINVHHIRPYAQFKDVRLDPNNGVSLCVDDHRRRHSRNWTPSGDYIRIDKVPCGCGCGQMIFPLTEYGQPRRYARYHNRRGTKHMTETRAKIAASLKGQPLDPDRYEKIATRNRSAAQRIKSANANRGERANWPNDCPLTQAEFATLYPNLPLQALAAQCGRSTQFVRSWGARLSLKRNDLRIRSRRFD